ncbi:MAG: hypothetical protein LBP54_07120 [Campylobacteraceae bacterium]|jgi:hypothetical protein|nr:hypothetical protein [Campylobacteraceae bacterium]
MAWYTDNNANLLAGLAGVYDRMGKNNKYTGYANAFDEVGKAANAMKLFEDEEEQKAADNAIAELLGKPKNTTEDFYKAMGYTPKASQKGVNAFNLGLGLYNADYSKAFDEKKFEWDKNKTYLENVLAQQEFEEKQRVNDSITTKNYAQAGYYDRSPKDGSNESGENSGSSKFSKSIKDLNIGNWYTGEDYSNVRTDIDNTIKILGTDPQKAYDTAYHDRADGGFVSADKGGRNSWANEVFGWDFDEDKIQNAYSTLVQTHNQIDSYPMKIKKEILRDINNAMQLLNAGRLEDFQEYVGGSEWKNTRGVGAFQSRLDSYNKEAEKVRAKEIEINKRYNLIKNDIEEEIVNKKIDRFEGIRVLENVRTILNELYNDNAITKDNFDEKFGEAFYG